jgi:putative heme-binding domain-containing protein
MKGTPTPPPRYKAVAAFPRLQFQKPTSIEEIPGTQRLLVTEMAGRVLALEKRPDVERAELMIDLRSSLPQELRTGSISLFDAEFDPRFTENRFLYLCYVHPGQNGHTRVSRFRVGDDNNLSIDANSELVVITWPAGGHNGGCLEFGNDGMLYIATGDGSGPNPPDGLTTGQDVSDLLGSILRIDVRAPRPDHPYRIPDDNPLRDVRGARPEIWAYGLRNPWKFGIDPVTGDVMVADNGWESWELIHRADRGVNCGWPVMEGRAALRSEVPVGPTPIRPPVKDHPHTEANSVIGGPVYRGSRFPELDGWFVYGDYITGTLWAVHREQDDSYSHLTLVDTDLRIVAFTQGTKGELFILDYDVTGQIYELQPSTRPDLSAGFPRRLSETGLFASVADCLPAAGVVPYAVRVPRWHDGATAERWVAIPGDAVIPSGALADFSAKAPRDGDARGATGQPTSSSFPDGTVLVKHLSLPDAEGNRLKRIETQILHLDDGTWNPYSYLWDDDGRDAALVDAIGTSRRVHARDETGRGRAADRTWHVNAVNECKLCHNAGPGYLLGFVPNQLITSSAAGKLSPGEAARGFVALGVLDGVPKSAGDDALRLADPNDRTESLDARARSYLHVNCAMCHHPGGNAIVSFFLRRDLPFEKLNTNKGTGIGTFGMREARLIRPGDPYRSVLTYRIAKLGYGRMPYIGSRLVDSLGVSLIEQWIRDLPIDDIAVRSAPLDPSSSDAIAMRVFSQSGDTDPAQRVAAARQLTRTTEGALALAMKLHGGTVDAAGFDAAVRAGTEASGDIRGLFETFVAEAERRPTLGPAPDPATILDRQGSVDRGRLIFHSDSSRCRSCHDVNDQQKSLGPSLREINKKYPVDRDLLQHVLQPSLKVDEPFAAYLLLTVDGTAVTGLLREQSAEEVVLQTAERKQVRVSKQRIETLQRSSKSLMPDQLLSDLTPQEAADLFAYIRSLGGAN